MREIIIDQKNEGGRIDKLVIAYLGNVSTGFVYKQLRKKNIVLNDKKAEGNEILVSGDVIKIYFSESTFENFKQNKTNLLIKKDEFDLSCYIIFEDENIIALNKPEGMLSQKAKADDISIDDYLKEYLNTDCHVDGFTPGISNRLDRNTSGIILAGKNLSAARALNNAIKDRTISKKYWCIVKGIIKNQEHIEGYLVKDNRTNKVDIINMEDSHDGEKIITEYKPIISNEKETLLEVNLITGKSHQIRAHLASINHPLAGDYKYGEVGFNNYFKAKYNLTNQILHAKTIEFDDVKGVISYLNGKKLDAELPEKFKNILIGEGLWQPGKAEA